MVSKSEIKNMPFEEAVSKLEEIVNKFESEQVDLERAIENYAVGEELRKHCQAKLNEAKLKVEKISITSDGGVDTSEFSA